VAFGIVTAACSCGAENRILSSIYTMPLRGITGPSLFLTGDFNTIASGLVGDYATDFTVSNNHVFLSINSADLTGAVDVTITGTIIDEITMIPSPTSEVITIDDTADQLYQTDGKFWEITDVSFGPGVTSINYDVGSVGYTDLNNSNFRIVSYRVDAVADGAIPGIRFKLIKVKDEGSKVMSLVDLEDIEVLPGPSGAIVDHLRGTRDFTPVGVNSLWNNDSTLVFKQGDFDAYFAGENTFRSLTHNEGLIIKVEDSSLVDHLTLSLRYVQI
jgi:hypothetical protein